MQLSGNPILSHNMLVTVHMYLSGNRRSTCWTSSKVHFGLAVHHKFQSYVSAPGEKNLTDMFPSPSTCAGYTLSFLGFWLDCNSTLPLCACMCVTGSRKSTDVGCTACCTARPGCLLSIQFEDNMTPAAMMQREVHAMPHQHPMLILQQQSTLIDPNTFLIKLFFGHHSKTCSNIRLPND